MIAINQGLTENSVSAHHSIGLTLKNKSMKFINIFIRVIGTLSVKNIMIVFRAHHISYTFINDYIKRENK